MQISQYLWVLCMISIGKCWDEIWLEKIESPLAPVSELCVESSNNLKRLAAKFITCASSNSRPFSLCKNCIGDYLRYREAYDIMLNDNNVYGKTLFPEGLLCRNIVEASDKVQAPLQIFSTIDNIWQTANCESCFESHSLINGTVNFTINRYVEDFFNVYHDFVLCIYNYTRQAYSLEPIFEDYGPNCTLCKGCRSYYENLTNAYNLVGDETQICMDLLDTFNYTRIVWSNGYKCNFRVADEGLLLAISSFCFLVTIAFYVISRISTKKEPRQIVQTYRRRNYVITN